MMPRNLAFAYGNRTFTVKVSEAEYELIRGRVMIHRQDHPNCDGLVFYAKLVSEHLTAEERTWLYFENAAMFPAPPQLVLGPTP